MKNRVLFYHSSSGSFIA